jgi:Ca2+ transporting ATPase
LVCAVGVKTRSGKAGEKLRLSDDDDEEEHCDEKKKEEGDHEGEEKKNEAPKSSKKTPLQIKLDVICDQVGKVGLGAAILTFTVLTGKLLVNDFILRDECDPTKLKDPNCLDIDYIGLLKEIIRFFIIGITIVVVAIPEGLPLAVTISLAYSVGQMKEENCLVRRLDASETMGGADQICTDKTGTLT